MKPRWYQTEATDALMGCLGRDVHPIVVAPTGSGKSLMICDFIDRYLTQYPRANVLVLSHVQEILKQDHDALTNYFEGIEIGLYSAGMGSRTVKMVTVGGIQSVYSKPELFRNVTLIIIDECHLVTIRESGMYRTFLLHMDANYIGFTATHFRLGHGYIHKGEGALFNHVAYDMSAPDLFNRLVDEHYLTNLITKATVMKMDVARIRTRAHDFVAQELSLRFDRDAITEVAVEEIIEFGENYKKWLVFAIDIKHAEHVTQALIDRGVRTAVVHSKMTGDRKKIVADFKQGSYRAVVNVDILTTGLDVPDIDLIAMLRPTQSPIIHVQSFGRGLRVAPGKSHCLILDFAGNTQRLGPINDVVVKQKKKGQPTGEAVVKECPKCHTLVAPATRFCGVCGYEFKFKTSLSTTAGTHEVIKKNETLWHKIDQVTYTAHEKPGKPTTMKVTYRIGLQTFCEWICFGHNGYPKYKADNWVRFRAPELMPWPNNVHELIEFAPWMRQPTEVLVNFSERFPQIKDAKFE